MTIATSVSQRTPKARLPVTAHPAFPLIVALWFAALLGLSSLAVPVSMMESAVSALGLPKLFAAFGSPLGMTARLLLALGLALAGGFVGITLGRKLNPAYGDAKRMRRAEGYPDEAPALRARDRHPDAPARRPFSPSRDVQDFLPEGGSSSNSERLRARAQASEQRDDERPFYDYAPLPGSARFGAGEESEPEPASLGVLDEDGDEHGDDHFELTEFAPEGLDAAEAAPVADLEHFSAPIPPVVEGSEITLDFTRPIADLEEQNAPVVEEAEESDGQLVAASAGSDRSILNAPLESLGIVQLVERLAMAIANRRENAQAEVAPTSEPEPIEEPAADPSQETTQLQFAPADLDEDEPVEAISDHAEEEPVTEEVQAAEPAPQHEPELAAPRPAALPAFMSQRIVAHDDEDEEEAEGGDLARFAMPRSLGSAANGAPSANPVDDLARGLEILARRNATNDGPPPVADEADEYEDDEDEDADPAADAYPSLLGLRLGGTRDLGVKPAGDNAHAYVRIEEPESEPDVVEPMVVFPGHGARQSGISRPFDNPALTGRPQSMQPAAMPEPAPSSDAEETDRALKAALASLQRMSGAR